MGYPHSVPAILISPFNLPSSRCSSSPHHVFRGSLPPDPPAHSSSDVPQFSTLAPPVDHCCPFSLVMALVIPAILGILLFLRVNKCLLGFPETFSAPTPRTAVLFLLFVFDRPAQRKSLIVVDLTSHQQHRPLPVAFWPIQKICPPPSYDPSPFLVWDPSNLAPPFFTAACSPFLFSFLSHSSQNIIHWPKNVQYAATSPGSA